jgi:hypothetical protein
MTDFLRKLANAMWEVVALVSERVVSQNGEN